MNKPALLLLMLCFTSSAVQAQRSTPTQLQIDNLYSGEALDSYDLRPRGMEGSLYFRDEPLPAAIQLKNGKVLNGVPVRYNLEDNALEVYLDRNVFELPGANIREFTLEEEKGAGASPKRYRFVNRDQFEGGERIEGVAFLYYLLEDDLSLLGAQEVTILKPNYVPALDAGNLRPQAVQKERYYLYDGRGLQAIPGRRKRAATLLKPYRAEVEAYLKGNGVDTGKAEDLLFLFRWLNREP